jgi:hypothetical protein
MTPDIQEIVNQFSPGERFRFLIELAKRVLADHPGPEPLHLAEGDEAPIGFLIPQTFHPTSAPPMSAEDRKELQRRLDNRHQAVTPGEFFKLLDRASIAVPAQS